MQESAPNIPGEMLERRLRNALREFRQAAAARARFEKEVDRRFREETASLEKRLRDETSAIESRFELGCRERQERSARALSELRASGAAEQRRRKQEIDQKKKEIVHQYVEGKKRARAEFKEARWTITTINDADRKVARDRMIDLQRHTRAVVETMANQQRQGLDLLERWGLAEEEERPPPGPNSSSDTGDPWQGLQREAATATRTLESIRGFRHPGLLKGRRPHVLLMTIWLAASAPGLFFPEHWYFWLLGAALAVLPLGLVLVYLLRRDLRRRAAAARDDFVSAIHQARALRRACMRLGREEYRANRRRSKEKHQAALREAGAKSKKKIQTLRQKRLEFLKRLQETLVPRSTQAGKEQQRREEELEDGLIREDAAASQAREKDLTGVLERFAVLRSENNRRHAREWTALFSEWKQGCDRFLAEVREVAQECRNAFPPFDDSAVSEPAGKVPLGLPFGRLEVRSERIGHAVPQDPQLPRLNLEGEDFPALLPFPAQSSLLMLTGPAGRSTGLRGLETLLLRCWTGLPPGNLRCTLIDPVGRGENFAAFSHLADQDERLLDGRIWTEPAHIEQKLADLTGHMETVLQKHLRNRFATLAEYNAQAGEMAEPFRFLVVAHFPTNFTAESARRLISLAAAGARCGIYVFVLADPQAPMPHGVDLGDLEAVCTILDWRGDRFGWNDEDFGAFPLTLEEPPPPETCTGLLRRAGERARDRLRVQVPFERIADPEDAWWQEDSRAGLNVALGRSGALRFLEFTLGKGIAQHALVAGQTGSGKSTLLHVLILQLATRYSPREVELYLVDFKKGVEFEPYASWRLPHARVIAVESEREFGLSVLQKLDGELVRRGEILRAAGVNDLESYRGGPDSPAMPRIVLIVDEFQEFFVEEDRLAQDAALLLDRLVRQGRAFGMHVLLGSQTLGGAYSLARSTIDQMAVRIALQCGEADAHLILGRDNTEARLLSRPGEAIYNPAGGLVEANRLFQVAWLTDRDRELCLHRLRHKADLLAEAPFEPVVFAGNQAAELSRCRPLIEALAHPVDQEPPTLRTWLGDPVAIQDPTSTVWNRQGGANLVILGADGETAVGILIAAALGAIAQQPRGGPAHHHLVMAVSPGDQAEPILDDLIRETALQRIAVRELPGLLSAWHAEMTRRREGATGPSRFLYLHGLQRLRDLRKPEDDYSFSRREGNEPPTPHRMFTEILREGPALGLHVLAWCDSLASWQRSFDRNMLREFDLRVLLRMNAADSSTLIDTPAASRLSGHRALLYLEDQGKLEKFRPYGLPALEWVRRNFAPAASAMPTPLPPVAEPT